MTDQINEMASQKYRKLFSESTEIESIEQGRSLVVVIGINEYINQPELKNAVQDAKGIQQILCDKLGFLAPIPPLLNEEATKTAIVSLVEDRLYEIVEENDSLIVFFAGHGQTRLRKVGNKRSETGYIVPVDATQSWSKYVEIDSFLNNIGNLPARHILVILDCCHSGFALGHAVHNFRDPIVKFENKLSKQISRRVITSALKDEQALDGGGPILGHSLFTGILIDGLNCGKADLDGNGLISSSELGLFLQQQVQQTAMQSSHIKQTPDFGSFHPTHDRGEMIIALNKEKDLIDYTSLESHLKNHRWKEADLMTFAIMLKLSNCENKEYLDVEDIQKLAFSDLQSIDKLWTFYSDNHFGFSVQNKIWQSETINGNPRSGLNEFRRFGNSVGWNVKRIDVEFDFAGWNRESDEIDRDPDGSPMEYIWHRHKNLNFSLQAPIGHLPWGGYGELGMSKRWRLGYLFLRFSQDEKSDIKEPSKISSGGAIIGKPIKSKKIVPPPNINLALKIDIDDAILHLCNLLANSKWREADVETYNLMCEVVGKTRQNGLTSEDINIFPCDVLYTIDKIWLYYSDNRFSFTIQRNIFQGLGGNPEEYNEEIWCRFAVRIGHRKENGKWLGFFDMEQSITAPLGHLPHGGGLSMFRFSLFTRLNNCNC